MKIASEYLTGSPMSTDLQRSVEKERVDYFNESTGSLSDKLNSFSRFISRQNFAKFICYYEILKMTKDVSGSIIECGAYFGNAMMAYANLAAAFEPYNYQCKIVGFDTFEGDLGVSEKDKVNPYLKRENKDYLAKSYEDLTRAISIYDKDRPLNHMKKIELVKGDLCETAQVYVEANPSLSVRVLQLSVNLYKPTKAALDAFYPRVSKGGIVIVHGINYAAVGATQALIETVGDFNKIKLRTFDFYPNIVYFIV